MVDHSSNGDDGCCGGNGTSDSSCCQSNTSKSTCKCSENGASISDPMTLFDDDSMPPSPDDPEWDTWAEETLADTEFDTQLGKELARAAFGVASGNLSPDKFQSEFHTEVLDEFGLDERPTRTIPEERTDADGPKSPSPGVPNLNGSVDRRTMIKGAIASAGLLTVGTAAGQAMDATRNTSFGSGETQSGGSTQMGMAIDMERCIACLLCVEECKEENNTSNGANWMHVFRFSETADEEMDGSMPRPCQHCTDPSCTFVCPTQARFKRDEDGIVLTDYDLCIGCRYCEVGCPYGVNYFEWGEPDDLAGGFPHSTRDKNDRRVAGNPPEGVMGKCTFCVHRQEDEGRRNTTACEDVCPVDAIHFGDMTDPESDPNQHIANKQDAAQFKLLEEQGTGPNIVYIGNEPSMNAKPVEGPYSYEDLGIQKHRDRHNVFEGGEDE